MWAGVCMRLCLQSEWSLTLSEDPASNRFKSTPWKATRGYCAPGTRQRERLGRLRMTRCRFWGDEALHESENRSPLADSTAQQTYHGEARDGAKDTPQASSGTALESRA